MQRKGMVIKDWSVYASQRTFFRLVEPGADTTYPCASPLQAPSGAEQGLGSFSKMTKIRSVKILND